MGPTGSAQIKLQGWNPFIGPDIDPKFKPLLGKTLYWAQIFTGHLGIQ